MGCCSRVAMVAAVLSFTNIAAAQAPSPPAPGPMARAGYSVPWSLRPAVAANIVRLDSVYSVASVGNAWVSILTAGYRPVRSLPALGVLFRSGIVGSYPGSGGSTWALTSPTFISLFTPEIAPHVRLAPTLAFSLPIGAGGGNPPDQDPANRGAMTAGIYPRQSLDAALFLTNYMAIVAGLGAAWIHRGLTVQAEASLLQFVRVRGDLVDADEARTNFTTGLHVGYQVVPSVTLSAELHYQHWLSTPAAVARNEALRSQLTVGGGVRANIPVGGALLRPGVAFFAPVGGQMNALDYKVFQLDLLAAL